jgi:hypothetical protein
MPSVKVFLKPPSTEVAHRCSKTVAAALAAAYPRLVAYDRAALTLQLLTSEAWASIKARVRPRQPGVIKVNRIVIRDSGMGLMLSYPPAGQETDAPRRQRELWLGATRF